MAHRQSHRKGPATAVFSTHTPVTDHDEDNVYQDRRDIQQIADDSVAFLRTFSLRLQRFRAQVGEFAHTDHPRTHTDEEMTDNDLPEPAATRAGTDETTEPDEPSSMDELAMQTENDDCTPLHTEIPDATLQSPTMQKNHIPPGPDYTPNQPVIRNTYVTTRRFNIPPSLRGTYVEKYMRQAHTAVKLAREDPHLHNQPIAVDSRGGDISDEFNGELNEIIDRPAQCEPDSAGEVGEESTQPAGNIQQITGSEQNTNDAAPPRLPDLETTTPNQKQIKHAINSQTYPTRITRNHRTNLPRHREVPTVVSIANVTKKTTHAHTGVDDTTERDIEGLVPDRGKKPRYETRGVSVIYVPIQGPENPPVLISRCGNVLK